MTLLSSGALALAVALLIGILGPIGARLCRLSGCRACPLQILAMIALASIVALAASVSPSLARRSKGAQTTSAAPTPANASEAVCRSKARDYAYDKHADVGQERLFFDKCMGR